MSKGRWRSILLRTVAHSHTHAQADTAHATSSEVETVSFKGALENDQTLDRHPDSTKAKPGVEELTVASCHL